MSIIAWDGHTLAVDSACFTAGRIRRMQKLTHINGNYWAAICGNVPKATSTLLALKDNLPTEHCMTPLPDSESKFGLLLVHFSDEPKAWYAEGGPLMPISASQSSPMIDGESTACGLLSAMVHCNPDTSLAHNMAEAVSMFYSDSVFGPVNYVDVDSPTLLKTIDTGNDIP